MIIINSGKEFEQQFKASVPSDCYFLRLVDPPSSWGDNTNLRFSVKNPYDAILYSSPNLLTLELKSTSGTSFSFKGTTPMIKAHQIKALTEASIYEGIIPGFVFNMREPTNRTYFLHIDNFNKFIATTTKSSINEKDIISAEGMIIESQLKKVKYKYDIEGFIERLKKL